MSLILPNQITFDNIHIYGPESIKDKLVKFNPLSGAACFAIRSNAHKRFFDRCGGFCMDKYTDIYINLRGCIRAHRAYNITLEQKAAQVISHECLHILIEQTADKKASHQMDNISLKLRPVYPNAF